MTKEFDTSQRIDTFLSPKAFWDFSVKLYSQPKVQKILLKWQDELGANVNEVLFILWSIHNKIDIPDKVLNKVLRSNIQLSRVTDSFRKARRGVYAEFNNRLGNKYKKQLRIFKNGLLELELEFEAMQQRHLLNVAFEHKSQVTTKLLNQEKSNGLSFRYLSLKMQTAISEKELQQDIKRLVNSISKIK